MDVKVYCDGSSRGNPGPSGVGILVREWTGELLTEIQKYIGFHTNNEAEYIAIITALNYINGFKGGSERIKRVRVHTDSELVYRQVHGLSKVRKKKFNSYINEINKFRKVFDLEIRQVPSIYNQWPDKLAKQASKTGKSFSFTT